MCGRFDSYAKGSIVKDPAKLSFDYVPERLVHRDREVEMMFRMMRNLVDMGIPQHILLKGPVGTGKTATSHLFCGEFQSYASKSRVNLRCAFVNCRQRNTESMVMLKLLSAYDPYFPDRGFSTSEMLEILRKQLAKEGGRLVAVLDEVDVLLKRKGSDLIYSFTRFQEDAGKDAPISLILISQQNVLDLMDPSALSTFKRTNVVDFAKYDKAQLADIVADRVAIAFHPDAVSDETVELIADLASEWGDARYAIELLEKGAMSCDMAGRREMLPEDVRKARASTYASSVSPSDLGSLDRPLLLTLLGIARSLGDEAYTTTGAAEKEYLAACEEHGEAPRAHTQFWTYLKHLDQLGFIQTERSSRGMQGKTTMISIPDIPAKELARHAERALSRR